MVFGIILTKPIKKMFDLFFFETSKFNIFNRVVLSLTGAAMVIPVGVFARRFHAHSLPDIDLILCRNLLSFSRLCVVYVFFFFGNILQLE